MQENQEQRKINIVFATDDNYVQHLCCAIASLLENKNKKDNLCIFILNSGLTEENINNIEKLKSIQNFELQFCDMNKYNAIFDSLPLNRDYISKATYYRLMLLEVLPKNIDKIIYLDCDIIVLNDIANLYNENIEDFYAGVIEDEGSITQIKRMGFPIENNYFNAGILLLNLEKLRKINYLEECINFFEQNKEKIVLQDQDILNGVFNGKCKFLPLNWNANARLYFKNSLEHLYTKEQELDAKKHPYILHYTDIKKPWRRYSDHPLQYVYIKYLFKTPYKFKAIKLIFLIIIDRIFSIRNSNNHKIFTLLGLRIKIRRHKNG